MHGPARRTKPLVGVSERAPKLSGWCIQWSVGVRESSRNGVVVLEVVVLARLVAACGGEPPPLAPAPQPRPSVAKVASSPPPPLPPPLPDEPLGAVTVVEERRPGPSGLALVRSTLVWRRQQDIMATSLPGGKPSALGAGPHPGTVRPVSDGSLLYWFSAGFGDISAMPVSGGDVTDLPFKLPAGIRSLSLAAMGLNATSLFVVGTGSAIDPSHPETAALFSISLSDGAVQLLSKVPSAATGGLGVVADSDSVFWTSAGPKAGKKDIAPTIYEYSLSDKTNEAVHDFAPGTPIHALAGDKPWLYVSAGGVGGDGLIGRISKRTRAFSVVAEHVDASFFAVDDDNIYFTSQDAKTLSRVPKAGGVPEVIWHGDDRPDDVVVDDKDVYWVDHTNMSIMRIGKKAPGTPMSVADAGAPSDAHHGDAHDDGGR